MIRTPKLQVQEEYRFEIDLENEMITRSPPVKLSQEFHSDLKFWIGGSYKYFLENIANGLYINIGNALSVFPIGPYKGESWTNVEGLTALCNKSLTLDDFVFFAGDGCGETFAFYTAVRPEDGEYPIVWYTPGSQEFVYVNSSFDRFLTMQYYMLKATEFEAEYTEEEAGDPKLIEDDNANWQLYHANLYRVFDPNVPISSHNLFQSAVDLSSIKEVLADNKY